MFENYSPQCLRDAIEIELRKVNDAKMAAIIAMKNLDGDPDYYEQYGVLAKARQTKYIRRIPKPGGGYKYIYKEDIKKEKKPEKPKNQTETKEFKEWFGDSKVVNKDGKPKIVYHWTRSDESFSQFNPMSHFGTLDQAEDRGKRLHSAFESDYYNERIIPVFLKIENPIKLKDEGSWYYETLGDQLLDKKIINNKFYEDVVKNTKKKIYKAKQDNTTVKMGNEIINPKYYEEKSKIEKSALNKIINKLKSKGYDGIKYINEYESSESNDYSYIPFDPEQVKSATGNRGTFDPNNPDMTKARSVKYIKRIPKTGGGYRYFYTQAEYDQFKKEEQPGKESWISKFAGLFNLKDKRQVMQKLTKDYQENQIDKKFNLTWDSWKNHISEYFSNKEKWDNFFTGKKPDKKEKKKADKKEKKEKKEKVKKSELKLSVMKFIHDLYGESEQVAEDNFDTMPESKDIITDPARVQEIKNSIAEGEMILESGKTISGRKMSPDEISAIQRSVDNAKKKIGIPVEPEGGKKLPPHLQAVADRAKEYEVEDVTPEGYGPDDETNEAKKQYDKKVSKEINKVTPETRYKSEREITGIPEPDDEIDVPDDDSDFVPTKSTIDIPGWAGTQFQDYSHAKPRDIYLINQKDILDKPRPSYIPDVDEGAAAYWRFILPTQKISENKYIIKTNRQKKRYNEETRNVETIGEEKYVIVSRDVLAATHDYYIKKAKEEYKQKTKELEERTGRKYRKKRISMLPDNKMTIDQRMIMENFRYNADERPSYSEMWDSYKSIRNDIKQKLDDMEIQVEEYYNTHAKGRETAYGDEGLNDKLYNNYGVMVKRQNGEEINDSEINQIQKAIESVFSATGNRSSMAQSFGLKISHSGEVLMHARKAAGLFMPSMKAIGVTAKYGEKGTGFILAHEFAHFMDYYVGEKTNRHYISDDPESTAGKIASRFRSFMSKSQSSKYQNRTCECFARAMEQYWSIKTDNEDVVLEFDKGNHPTKENFETHVMPLIDDFFTEYESMLKAMGKELRFIKIFNPKKHEFEYRKLK